MQGHVVAEDRSRHLRSDVEVRALDRGQGAESHPLRPAAHPRHGAVEGYVEGHRLGHAVQRQVPGHGALAARTRLDRGGGEGDGGVLGIAEDVTLLDEVLVERQLRVELLRAHVEAVGVDRSGHFAVGGVGRVIGEAGVDGVEADGEVGQAEVLDPGDHAGVHPVDHILAGGGGRGIRRRSGRALRLPEGEARGSDDEGQGEDGGEGFMAHEVLRIVVVGVAVPDTRNAVGPKEHRSLTMA